MTDPTYPSAPLLASAGDRSEIAPSRSTTRKKASTACTACRARRSKCTGGTPCLSCMSHRTECIKDESEDGRRRIAIKRKLEGLEEGRVILKDLLMLLKHSNESQITSLVNLVRDNASHDELKSFLEEHLKDPEKLDRRTIEEVSPTGEPGTSPAQSRRPRTGHIGDLINPPIQVPAKPWTNVTDDDDFVSHLISLWFTWTHPWFHWVGKAVFIEAMQSQDLRNPLCTPYLVNSILAEACLLDAPDVTEHSYHGRIRERFMAQAKAGIDAEQGNVSLTMIQALGVQWTSLYLNGQDRLGRLVLNSQIFLAKGLSRWRTKLSQVYADAPVTLEKVDSSLTYVDWVLFGLTSFNLAEYHAFHSHLKPQRSLPEFSCSAQPPTKWIPYPLYRNYEVEFHPECHLRSMISLAEKVAENEALSAHRERGEEFEGRLRNLVQDLREWPDLLPVCMRLHTHAMPHALVLHALHNWVILVLAKQAAAAVAGRPKDPIITATPASNEGAYWQSVSISRAVNIADLMQNYGRNWSLDYLPPIVMQPLSLAVLTLMENLTIEENRISFITLMKVLQAASRKYRVAKGVMRVVKNTARNAGTMLPIEVEAMLEPSDRPLSDREASNEGSDRRTEDSPDREITVDYLLEKWEDLALDVEYD